MSKNLLQLPDDLPVPEDDGGAAHLVGSSMPVITLPSTSGGPVELGKLSKRTVIYAYPRTGVPDEPTFFEGWEAIPGARGCTPESCTFREHHDELQAAGADVYGLSTQDTTFQRDAVNRMHLPFAILSDDRLELTHALNLPTFDVNGLTLLKRITLVVKEGKVEHVFYPVFPPDEHAEAVLAWLNENPA
jgi:peroxiredoxin